MEIGAIIFATEYTIPIDELARELEQRGFGSLVLPEHTHIPTSRISPWPGGAELPREYSNTYDPFVALSFAAAATKTLKLATGICLVAQRDPIVTAKSVASLDVLSGGRVIFGIGGGWNVEEMNHHGVEYKTRFKQLREHVLAMKSLWTEEEASYSGDFVNFGPTWCWPKPAQKPHPPVIIGGETDYTINRVIEFGDGWLPRASPNFDPTEGMKRLRLAADKAGRDMSSLSVTVFRAPPDAQVLESYAQAGIARSLLMLPTADRDTVLRLLDEYTPLAG
ncbi:MAG: LLM class F420-dependent oxidoreductase [Proteobacteria bacterium]|nr:LLM class F420-dependent oxidoreductase [Pseudomonadota bacterium]